MNNLVAQHRLCRLLVAASFLISSDLAWSFGYDLDPYAFPKLPRHCQAWFAEASRLGKVPGPSVDLRSYELNLSEMVGKAAVPMNHYCPALVRLIRYDRGDMKLWSERKKRKRLWTILEQIQYQLRLAGWNESNRWFKAEVLKNIGHVYQLLGDEVRAVKNFQEAIETFPPYLPAYWELAEVYESSDRLDSALLTLRSALKYAKKKSYQGVIEKRIEKLEQMARGASEKDGKLVPDTENEEGAASEKTSMIPSDIRGPLLPVVISNPLSTLAQINLP